MARSGANYPVDMSPGPYLIISLSTKGIVDIEVFCSPEERVSVWSFCQALVPELEALDAAARERWTGTFPKGPGN